MPKNNQPHHLPEDVPFLLFAFPAGVGATTAGAIKTGTAATQLLKADIPPLEDPLLHYMSSLIMRHGRRHRASKTVSLMLQHIHALTGSQPMDVLRAAVQRAAPSVKTVTMKRGMKVIYQPTPLSERQRTREAVKWLLRASMYRSGPRLITMSRTAAASRYSAGDHVHTRSHWPSVVSTAFAAYPSPRTASSESTTSRPDSSSHCRTPTWEKRAATPNTSYSAAVGG